MGTFGELVRLTRDFFFLVYSIKHNNVGDVQASPLTIDFITPL